MIYSYLRPLFDKRNIGEQQRSILSFSLGRGLDIDKEVIEYSKQNLPIEERGQFEKFIHGLKEGDAIIVDEIWMLSEKVDELVKIIHCMLSRGIILYNASSGTAITVESSIGEIFPLLNKVREEQKKRQNILGRPKGSKSRSKFDQHQTEIVVFLREGVSVSEMARKLSVHRSSLKDYIESRGIREMIEESWIDIASNSAEGEADNKLLICPFEQITSNKQTKKES